MLLLSSMQFQFDRCRCQNETYTKENGDHVLVSVCCAQCWRMGMATVREQLDLEMDVVVKPASPAAASLFPGDT